MILDNVDSASRSVLERYGFDEARFEALVAKVASGELSKQRNVIGEALEPPVDGDIVLLPEPGQPGYDDAREVGIETLRAGRVAHVILSGGMATRFGGVVKGAVEVMDGKSFLELAIGETRRVAGQLGASIPIALMTSFATDRTVRELVSTWGLEDPPLFFKQTAAVRLQPDGRLFRDRDGRVSLYAPGHGDLIEAIVGSGTLRALRGRRVHHVVVSNVDNLGARIDPVVIGMHVLGDRSLTLEVAPKEGDVGGAPVRVDGRLTMVEGPRFPDGFDMESLTVLNTNTAIVDAHLFERGFELTWLYVERAVDGRNAVQLERLYHELSAFVPAQFLEVPRRGPRGRFFPIKQPEDLERSRGDLRELLSRSTV